MEHAEVENSQAVERYLLNEMREDERDRFEEHYFDCRICAAEVTIGTRLLDSGRVIAREMSTVVPMERRSRLMTWLPLASAAILTILVATLLVPRRSEPSLEIVDPPHQFSTGLARSDKEPPATLPANKPSVLSVDVRPGFSRYEIVIRDAGRKVVSKQPVGEEQAREPIHLLIGSLPAGNYVLAVEGVNKDGSRIEIDQKQFRVQ